MTNQIFLLHAPYKPTSEATVQFKPSLTPQGTGKYCNNNGVDDHDPISPTTSTRQGRARTRGSPNITHLDG